MNEAKKKKKKRVPNAWNSVFAPVYPMRQGTPSDSSTAIPPPNPGPGPVQVSSIIPPSRRRTLHELRKILRPLQEMETPNPNWQGITGPSPLQVNMRQGGPVIGGPGFGPDTPPGQGGRYDFRNSPGIGLGTEMGWKIWKAALDIMEVDKTLSVSGVLQAAIQRCGVNIGQLAGTELRLLEMGVQWYLSDPGRMDQPKDGVPGGMPGGVSGTQSMMGSK